MKNLAGKVVFITGGASGIGLAMAEAFAREGSRVVLADIDGARLEVIASQIHGDVMTLVLDTSDREAWPAAKHAVEARFGPVDILCNNAGIGSDGKLLSEVDPTAFDRTIRINLLGVFNGINCFVEGMMQRRSGYIVNTASLAGLVYHPRIGAYSAAKAAVIALTETLRQEGEAYNVGATVVCPGRVATRIEETTLAAGSARPESSQLPPEAAQTIEPGAVADAVIEAVKNDQLYVISHGAFRTHFEKRVGQIMEAFDRAAI